MNIHPQERGRRILHPSLGRWEEMRQGQASQSYALDRTTSLRMITLKHLTS